MSRLLERLRDPVRSGVYRVKQSLAIDDALKEGKVEIDLEGGDALRAFARTLHFPDWFGHNWDALEDCLGELPGDAHVLVLRNWQKLEPDDLGVLIDVLRSSAEFWSGRGKPFFAVLVDPEKKLALPALHREP